MKVIVFERYGFPDVFELKEAAKPNPYFPDACPRTDTYDLNIRKRHDDQSKK